MISYVIQESTRLNSDPLTPPSLGLSTDASDIHVNKRIIEQLRNKREPLILVGCEEAGNSDSVLDMRSTQELQTFMNTHAIPLLAAIDAQSADSYSTALRADLARGLKDRVAVLKSLLTISEEKITKARSGYHKINGADIEKGTQRVHLERMIGKRNDIDRAQTMCT